MSIDSSDNNDTNVRVGLILRLKGTNKIVIEHATGHKPPSCYDIPKGHLSKGENLEDGLKREVLEEVGIDLANDQLTKLGLYEYRGGALQIFYLEKDFDINTFHCDSTFTDNFGRERPEVDGYEFFDFVKDDLETSFLYKGLKPILSGIFESIKNKEKLFENIYVLANISR